MKIRRPRTRNALNRGIYTELRERFREIGRDDSIAAAVLPGFGAKDMRIGLDNFRKTQLKKPAAFVNA